MDDAKKLIREWLDLSAGGPAEGWIGKVADDVALRLPYAPSGVAKEMDGFDAALAALAPHWASKRSFEWHDVVVRATEDPGLFVTTARSQAVMVSGKPYGNDYIMLTRVEDGMIVAHTEYFDPLKVMALLAE